MSSQILAILWAQWRSMRNFRAGGSKAASWFTSFVGIAWYAIWVLGAVAVGLICSEESETLPRFLTTTLFLVLLYWQLVPVFMASSGLSLDLRRLIAYPVPHRDLFQIEVLLRVTTAGEMVLIALGIIAGLALNPRLPWWAPLGAVPFLFFNLFLAAGLRDLLGRFFARKGIREISVLVIVLIAASMQLILSSVFLDDAKPRFTYQLGGWWPWSAAAAIGSGTLSWRYVAQSFLWLAAAFAFGRWQFERSLRFDATSAAARKNTRPVSRLEGFYRFPSLIFRDPLAAMIEKELRFLSRSPRFRLVFFMGFSFGLLIWLPLTLRSGDARGPLFGDHFLTAITVYALMLLGEVCFWNSFGFDRRAVQMYFAAPVPFSSVLLAKNLASLIFVAIEMALITLICFLLRAPLSPAIVLEAFSVTLVMTFFLLAIGNMLSTRVPKPVDPTQTWRRSAAGKVQAFLLVIYLVVAAPIALAYLAGYAFDSRMAFYGVLGVDAVIAAIVYFVALDSSVGAALNRKEYIITTLSQAEGPVG